MYKCIRSFSSYRLGQRIEENVYNSLTSNVKKYFVNDEETVATGDVDTSDRDEDDFSSENDNLDSGDLNSGSDSSSTD